MAASVTFRMAPIVERPGWKPYCLADSPPPFWIAAVSRDFKSLFSSISDVSNMHSGLYADGSSGSIPYLLRPAVVSLVFRGKCILLGTGCTFPVGNVPVSDWQFPALRQAECHRAPELYRVLVRLQLLPAPLRKMVKIPYWVYSVVVHSPAHEWGIVCPLYFSILARP